MKAITIVMIISLISQFVISVPNKLLLSLCDKDETRSGNVHFNDKISGAEFDWNFVSALKKGRKLGGGSFGQVYSVAYPAASVAGETVAMKKITPERGFPMGLIANEINVAMKMNASPGSPKLFGCVYDISSKTQEYVYIITEKMETHLRDSNFRQYIRTKVSTETQLKLMKNLFMSLKYLWDLGYVHNDIKPENMMVNKAKNKLVLIDYGLAQKKEQLRNDNGSPMYMSPGKLLKNGRAYSPKDDLYSLALSISEIFAKKIDDAFVDPATRRLVVNSCFTKKNRPACQTQLKNAAITVLKPYFGDYQANKAKGMTFTTLIADLIDYHNISISYEEAIQVIDSLIASTQKKKVIKVEDDAEVEEYNKNEAMLKDLLKQHKEISKSLLLLEDSVKILTDEYFLIDDEIKALERNPKGKNTNGEIEELKKVKNDKKALYNKVLKQTAQVKEVLKMIEAKVKKIRDRDMMASEIYKDQNINNAFFEAEDNKKVMFKGKNALANKGKVKIIPRKDEKKKQII